MDAAQRLVQGSAPWRVLIADDEALVRASLADMAELAGYVPCGEAHDGYEATRLVDELRPDVILMDVTMPRMDGIEALQLIRATRPTCALILSAHCSSSLVERAASAGAQGYLVKPCRQTDLVPAIETAIAQFQRLRLTSETERMELLFERAWGHVCGGGSLHAAVERALAASSRLIGAGAFALLVRRGVRLQVWSAQGLDGTVPGCLLGPVEGPLGAALRRGSVCQTALVGGPAEASLVLSAPIVAGSRWQGCLSFFGPAGRFTSQEECLAAAAARCASGLLQRAEAGSPRAWQRWTAEDLRPALAGRGAW